MPHRGSCIDFVMQVLRCDTLKQFLQGDGWWTERRHEYLPVEEGHVHEHALLQM
jgi:hypothetical protein